MTDTQTDPTEGHTAEPWRVEPEEWTDGKGIAICAADAGVVAVIDPSAGAQRKEDEANARRIVACVNGCDGLDPAAYRECVEALAGLVEWLDISGLTSTADGGHGPLAYKGTEYSVVTDSRAALAKARGAS